MGDRRESEGDPEAYSLTGYLYPYVLRTSKVLLYSLALGKLAAVILLYLPYSTIRYLSRPGADLSLRVPLYSLPYKAVLRVFRK